MKSQNSIIEPPDYIDGAKVIKWAWSGASPFYQINSEDNTSFEDIFGLAVCQYEGSNSYYSFSCDRDWETIQDAPYNSIENAMRCLRRQNIIWNDK